MPMTRRPPYTPLRGLLRMLLQQPLWAIPFALFFALLNSGGGHGADLYLFCYELSLVMAYSIGLSLWVVRSFVDPRLRDCPPDLAEGPDWRIGAVYMCAAVFGSYLGAIVIHLTLYPQMLSTPRAWLISSTFTLLFCALIGGIRLARVFYRQALDRSRAVETMRAELAEAELRALRAQINPHFLFNTLNSIAALIRIDPAAAETTTTRLADVFRYTLRASESTHTRLGDELAFVREYLAIERTRFAERLRVVESIEPGLEALEVPGLLLQPLVENAVRYAVSPRSEGGEVRIGARREGQLLKLTVSDDGPGLTEKGRVSGSGFGLHSVRERLRAAGPPHAIDIRTAPGQGTEIELTIPIRPEAPPTHTRSPGGTR